ncbi:TPA: ead/Ea22-like family protein [Enterobacter asburiae]
MSNIDKQALLRLAVKIGAHTWGAEGSHVFSMSNGTAETFVLEVCGDETSSKQDCDIASFIAAANPAAVIMLLDELKESQAHEANESSCADNVIDLAINWQIRCKDTESKLEAAEKRIAVLEASHSNLREAMAGIHNTIKGGGAYTPLAAILTTSKRAYEESAAAAGITTKGE